MYCPLSSFKLRSNPVNFRHPTRYRETRKNMSRLNARRILNALPKDKEYKLHDGNGLFLRIRSSGAKSWLFSFSLPDDKSIYRMTLGSFEKISLKEARAMIPELHKLVSQGIDPRSARAAARTENAQAVTMGSLFEAWIEFLKLTNKVTPDWIKTHEGRWKNHLKNPLGSILARDVTRAHLAAALDTMSRKGITEETRKALTTLNLMLDYGLTRHLIGNNPARLLKPKDFAASANRARDRVLSLPELRKLWATLDETIIVRKGVARTSTMSIITATAIKLLILTGTRRGELAAMRWDEINFKAGMWTIPAEKTKNRQSHIVYLSDLSKQLLEKIGLLTSSSPFVFDTGLNSHGHIHTDALTRSLRRLIKEDKQKSVKRNAKNKTEKTERKLPLKDMKPFTIHDLRRSAATAWGEHLKIKPHVIERMLNHQPLNKLVATYQRATYANEQKTAWIAWSTLIERNIAHEPDDSSNEMPTNVIKINIAANQ